MISREKKRFSGGYLSLRQVMYLMLGTAGFGICAFSIPISMKILFISIWATFFLLCTFFKIGEQNFDKFFFYAMKFVFRKKDFVYERCGKW